MQPRTLFEKLWASHVIGDMGDGRALIHIDRHVIFEESGNLALDALRRLGLTVRDRALTYGVIDHTVSTATGRDAASFPASQGKIVSMRENCRAAGIELFDIDDPRQGITHVVAPELGIALPGCTLVCGDSHTTTNGALGVWAWGIGATEVRHVLANQALIQRKPNTMRVSIDGRLGPWVSAKDVILRIIRRYGSAAGSGFVVEYAGPVVRRLGIEGRLTLCNMTTEFGSRSGMVGVDDATIEYVAGRPAAPTGALWDAALDNWRDLHSDDDASFDSDLRLDCSSLDPQVSWGLSARDVCGIDDPVPAPADFDAGQRAAVEKSLRHFGLTPGQSLQGIPIDVAFIGSCTNARLSDLEAAAAVVRGRKVAEGVRALCVPGSAAVKRAAEARGLDVVFRNAGFEWRESGCSMCAALNGDVVPPGRRCMSTSNRSYENRQGPGSRTHIASPAMVAAAAVSGCIVDLRKLPGL